MRRARDGRQRRQAVGRRRHRSRTCRRQIEEDVCRRLGLEPAPVASQVIQRDRHAELLSALAITGASLEKFALEIRGLQKTEIGEVEEPFGKGQKGSSAMPHKRNPIGCEQIVGLARLLRGNAHAALENIALWHERDISHSSVERVILPDSFIALDHMLRRFTRIVARHGRERRAHARESEPLARRRVFRARCCSSSRRRASRASRPTSGCSATRCARSPSSVDFKAAAARRSPTSRASLPAVEIERAFDLDEQLKHVDYIFDRVFDSQRDLELAEMGDSASRGPRLIVMRSVMRARVFVTLKPSVFDPQGRTIADALQSLGYRQRRGRPAGQNTSSSISRRPSARRPSARRRRRRQGARQPGDRELSHRGGLIMKFGIVVFPGQQLRRGRVSRRQGSCSARTPNTSGTRTPT